MIYMVGGLVFIDGKCFNRNYRLVFDIQCSSCTTFLKLCQKYFLTKKKDTPFIPLGNIPLAKQTKASLLQVHLLHLDNTKAGQKQAGVSM